ncbi:tripartite motif-containing protein 2-like [Ptychodera flava]|uniref:tripartite motif-containing protein 2-like n=1 Tax=Ptychodera flava TaxID=63121 RepID=UPI003969E410
MAARLSGFPEEISENFLCCEICLERYKNAKILPCLHSFCEPCLGKLAVKTGAITCPTCRRSHEVPGSGVSGIETNVFMNDLVELFNNQSSLTSTDKCEICGQDGRSTHCIECALDMCNVCENGHKVIPSTKSHRLVPLDAEHGTHPAGAGRFFVRTVIHCSRHSDYKIEYYCDTCCEAICLKCTALDHARPEHQYRCVKDAAADSSNRLTAMIDEAKMKETQACDSKMAVKQTSESLDACFRREEGKTIEHVRKTIEEITRLIQDDGDRLLQELKVEYNTRKDNLNAQLKELEIVESDLSHAAEYAEYILRYGNAAQLMTVEKMVVSQLAGLLKIETKTNPVEGDYLEFEPRASFFEKKSLGVINTSISYRVSEITEFPRRDEEIVVTVATVDTKTSETVVGRRVFVDAVMTSPDQREEKLKVHDNGDGTLSVKTRAKTEGQHEFKLSVRKNPVQGSPVRVKVIPRAGLLCRFGQQGSAVGQFNYPYGVTLTKSGDALVCDYNNNRLQCFTSRGQHKKVLQIKNLTYALRPFDAAVSADGNIFITDAGNKQIFVCDGDGKLIGCFGTGRLKCPIGITISPANGRVYVVDYSSHCIHVYGQDGNHIKSFGRQGSKRGEFYNPYFVCTDREGKVYVSDSFNDRIQVFNAYGQFLNEFGAKGSGDGQLNCPLGVTVDKDGYVYVADSRNRRIVKYVSDGKFVGRVDSDKDGLRNPHGICVTDDEPFGQVFVVDQANNCVKVFAQ